MRRWVLAFVLMFIGLASAATGLRAQTNAGDQWVLIGQLKLDRLGTHESIEINQPAAGYKAVRLEAKSGDVVISRVQVVWQDAAVHSEERTIALNAGERTKPIGEQSIARRLNRIGLVYQVREPKGAAVLIEAWGLKSAVAFGAPVASRGTPRGVSPVDQGQTRSVSPTASSPVAAGAPAATAACITATTCTPVPVFFGTNRQRKDEGGFIQFTKERGDKRLHGQATVTVPRANRKAGGIPRPAWSDLLSLSNPYREDPARHFTILAGATKVYASDDEFITAMKAAVAGAKSYKEHAFIFVHGFNVSFDNALFRAAQIAYDLGSDDTPFGTAFLFSWPSAGEFASYVDDLDSSSKAVSHLEGFIDLVVANSGASHVHLIGHSMGNAPLMAALDAMAKKSSKRTVIDQIILASPDVDAKDFAEMSARILPIANTLTLYASANDRAILASRKMRRDRPRAGDVVNGLPVIVTGLDSIDASSVSTGILDLNHSAYADKKELLNDMRRLMLTNQRPPDTRDISIRRQNDPIGTFWRFAD